MFNIFKDLDTATPKAISLELRLLFVTDIEQYNKIAHIAPKLALAKTILDELPDSNTAAKFAAKQTYERIANEIKSLLDY